MYNFRRLLIAMVFFAAIACPTKGQAQAEQGEIQLSLAQLIERALQENYQIRIVRNTELITANNNTRGNAGMLPEVNITAQRRTSINNSQQQFFTGDSQQANNAKSTATSANLEASWVVFDGLAMFARKDQLAQLQQLSKADTRFFMEQTVADLASTYYQLQQENQLLAAFRESLDVSQERLDFTERSYELGNSNMLDVQLARVDCNTDSALIVNQLAQIQELTIAINRLINRDLVAPIQTTDSIQLNPSLELPTLAASARANNASLNQQQLAELIAISEVDIRKGALFPEVELYSSFGFNRQANEVGFLQSNRSFGPEYGIRVRFNLFTGGREEVQRQNSLIQVQTEQLRTEDLILETEAALQVAYARWQSRVRQTELEQQSLAAAQEALFIAQRQYELGALTNVDFRLIQLNVVNANTRFLQAQLLAKQRELELLRLSGRLLEGGW
ncbi:TolC family protein [Lewinella sp. LCG006]|uniref:TolC family protein n=1 Tax=Lewinella sp. LCG006 TaxID=3231911 RepID=UPI00345F8B53